MDKEALLKSVNEINGVKGAMLVSKDGLVLNNSLSSDLDPNLVSAVLSSVFNNIDVQSKRMQRGEAKKFIVETEEEALTITEVDANGEKLLVFAEFGLNVNIDEINTKLKAVAQG